MELLLKIETARQAELAKALMDNWLDPEGETKKSAKAKLFAERKPAEPEKPTPLEVAIEEKKAAQDAQPAEEQSGADPFAALQAGAEPEAKTEAPAAEKPKKARAKKTTEGGEAAAATAKNEPEQDKPLTLDDIRKASTIALELIGAPVIQEALAKFEAIDQEKNALRMSALREADYGRYIEFLKKKVNDAAKEWPAA